jgi:hypothetical protein
MNRLKGSIAYLSGPIDASIDGGVGWRREITPQLKELGILILDPTNKPTNDFIEDPNIHIELQQLKLAGQWDKVNEIMKPIRNFDLRCCDKADFLIVYLDLSITMCGTFEEIFSANQSKKPVLIYCKQGKQAVPNWLFGTVPPGHIFQTMEDLVGHIRGIHFGGIEPNLNFWKFFDWSRIV